MNCPRSRVRVYHTVLQPRPTTTEADAIQAAGFSAKTRNGRPTVVFAEEDVLEYEGGMQLESILIHEFGHVVHEVGFDKGLQDRLTECFSKARERGIWSASAHIRHWPADSITKSSELFRRNRRPFDDCGAFF